MELFVSDFNLLVYRTVQRFKINEAPGVTLFYGPPGVGKSYWLETLYQRLKRQRQGLRIQKLDALSYSQQYAYSAQLANLAGFRRRMRTAEMLMIDDLQLLAGKQQSIEELLYTYEYLSDRGAKLVVNLRGTTPNLDFLGQRLSSRLLSGQTIPILLPQSAELRDFIDGYLRYHHLVAEGEAIVKMASILNNLSEVQYVVGEFVRFAESRESALTLECFNQFWDHSCSVERQTPTLTNILRVTAEVLGISPEEISGKRRTQAIVMARQLAMYLSKQLSAESYSEIGRFYQRRHGAVIEACRQMDIKVAHDKDLKESYWKIHRFFRD